MLLTKLRRAAKNNEEDGDWIPQAEMVVEQKKNQAINVRVTQAEKDMVQWICKRRDLDQVDVVMNGILLYEMVLREGAYSALDAVKAVRVVRFMKNQAKNMKLSEDVNMNDLDY